ncbi:DUF805 domain-containing protein [Clavibacter michiganensis]|nr:DUF805 domain-containing protein [Clavibacter michiganensis]PPF62614.1 DUF805 domain-containing protein [Clavibacter michiganensis]
MSSYTAPPATGRSSEPPIDQPYYGAPIGAAVKRFFTKYATFSGRASRSEYWWWTLVVIIVSIVLNVLSLALGGSGIGQGDTSSMTAGATVITVIASLWTLATIIPTLALAWRRLHDTNRSGAWYLLVLIPLIGSIILIVWFASAAKPEGQRFDR